MPEPLPQDRLAEIRARVEDRHLTPAPWKLDYEQCDCSDGLCFHEAYVTAVITTVPVHSAAERCARIGGEPRDWDFYRTEMCEFSAADWELMVHARQDIPLLLVEIAQLHTQLETANRQLADLDERCATAEHSTDRDYDEAAVPR